MTRVMILQWHASILFAAHEVNRLSKTDESQICSSNCNSNQYVKSNISLKIACYIGIRKKGWQTFTTIARFTTMCGL